MGIFEIEKELNIKIDPICKGTLVWKCYTNCYSSYGELVSQKRLKLLKRKSCQCNKCLLTLDFIQEWFSNDSSFIEKALKNLQDGETYAHVISTSRDYFDSHDEVDDIYFVKYKEDK